MELELYDIITLSNKKEYTILRMIEEEDGNTYFLLALMNGDEPTDTLEIVRYVKNDDEERIEMIEDEDKLNLLKEDFMQLLDEDM